MYTICLMHLMSSELPSLSTRLAMFISVGPAGYTSVAFVALGVQAQSILPPDFMSTSQIPCGEILRILGITAGIFLWLLAFWFSAHHGMGNHPGTDGNEFHFDLVGIYFLNGGSALAAIQIAEALDSFAIRVLTSVMTGSLVFAWLVVAGACVKANWQKKVLWPGVDDHKDIKFDEVTNLLLQNHLFGDNHTMRLGDSGISSKTC